MLAVTAGVRIEDAGEADLAAIAAIYNEVLATSTAIFSHLPTTLDERREWWGARRRQAYPVLVARAESAAALGEANGRGAGTALLSALLARATALGKHVMIGGVDASNAASIRFHERLGFVMAGQLHEVGYKFERWLDLVFLQRRI